jgi:hypothetical protein
MARYFSIVALCACLFGSSLALGANRDHVNRIADLIDNNYFHTAKARDVATELRSVAKSGAFDELTAPRDLAAALTARLRQIDRHFTVTWEGPSPARKTAQPPQSSNYAQLERRNAFGFRRVEMLPGGIGYIDLRSFADFDTAKADEPARRAADAALELIANADAVILDLRDNGGGSPAMVGYLVSAFTPADADIYNTFKSREGTSSERPQQLHTRPRPDVPLYVLISGRTASAAESTAYTLQAAKRAVIVGEPSAGAANPGGFFPVGDGFNVFISTGTPINPITGTNWEGKGVQPDIAIAAAQALQRAQVVALETVLAKRPADSPDLDAQWALDALRAEKAAPKGARLADYVGEFGAARVEIVDGQLVLRQGSRLPWKLARLERDTFFEAGEPSRRVVFERDAAGKVRGFEVRLSNGRTTWFGAAAGPAPR